MCRWYLCIDLKSFYASVECVARGLDPMTTNLVVADPERSDKTICLAVSPSLKKLGVPGRCRVFELPKGVDYIMAPPRMQRYIDCAADIYGVYLRYLSKDDIYVYSIDEAFMDVTDYLEMYGTDARGMAIMLMDAVASEVGVRAACGIGTNLYLAKIALDITAKHSPDFIGILDEDSYMDSLWSHRPLTDFWRIGEGTARKLERYGITTMERIARADPDLLYRVFGIDAELLIDHAWGREPVTISDIKAYKPKTNSLSSGQVLPRDYSFAEARIIVREMVDKLCLELVARGLVATSVSIYVGYSNSSGRDPAKGTAKFERRTSADSVVIPAVTALYERIVDTSVPVRRMTISCNDIVEASASAPVQTSLFDADDAKEKRSLTVQRALIDIKKKYGQNAILRGTSYEDAATARERNFQIGGHKSGEADQ